VDGERRYRACKLIPALEDVPVRINQDIKTEEDAAIQSFIINDQRQSYSPQDKEAYIHYLHKDMGLSTRKIAAKLGVHHSHVDHLLEAYRFRQKLPPTLVGTLQLTDSVLKNTAMVKDDNLRIRLLQAIQDKKLKTSEVSEIAGVLKKMPREVQEAYFTDLLDWSGVLDLARFVEDDGPEITRFIAKDIPLELKKDVINEWPLLQAAVHPELMNWLIEKETKDKNQFVEWHIQLNPQKDAKYIRSYAEKQIRRWQKKYKRSVKSTLINFKKKYGEYDNGNRRYTGFGSFWIEVYYWIMNSIMAIQKTWHLKDDLELRIAIIDMLYTHELLVAMRADIGDIEAYEKLERVKVPSSSSSLEELAAAEEEIRNIKARAENQRIEKIMMTTTTAEDDDKRDS
jgi:hypothetical protein